MNREVDIIDANPPGVTGWFLADVPEIKDGHEAYFLAWVINKRLDANGQIITERKPEIVRVYYDVSDSPLICTTRKHITDPWSYRGLPENGILWKGPLHY